MHRGPAWLRGGGGCSPFQGAVFWGLSDLTQARGWDPSCVPSPPAPYLRRPLSWSAQAAAVGQSRPAPHSGILLAPREPPETASSGGALALCDPCMDVGENSQTPSSPTHSPERPRTRVALQPSAHPSCPGQSVPAPPPSPPQPSCPRASLPCPRQEGGGVFMASALSLGNRPSSLWQGPPGRMCRSPSTLGSLDTTDRAPCSRGGGLARRPLPKCPWPTQALTAGPPPAPQPNHSHSPCPRPNSAACGGLLLKQQVTVTAASSWFGLLWKAALPGGP